MGDENVEMAISLGFTLIGMVLQFLRTAGVAEEVIEANWDETKRKHMSRPSDALPQVPE